MAVAGEERDFDEEVISLAISVGERMLKSASVAET